MKRKMGEILFSECVLINKELYFFETDDGLPAKMNLESGKISFLKLPYNYRIQRGSEIDLMQQKNGKIYALQNAGNNMLEYDLNHHTSCYFDINCAYNEWGNFAAFTVFESQLYIFPKYEKKVVKFDINEKKIYKQVYFSKETAFFCGCRVHDTMWLFPQNGNEIIAYDLRTENIQKHYSQIEIADCIFAAYGAEKVYVLNKYGIVYIWDMHDYKMQVLTIAELEHMDSNTVGRIVYAKGKLIMLPLFGKNIQILDLAKNTVEIYADYPDDFQYDTRFVWSKYYGICEDEEYFYFALRLSNYLLRIQKNSGMLSWIKPVFPDESEKFKILREKGWIMFKEDKCKLDVFVSNVQRMEKENQIQSGCGETIFEQVLKNYK